MIPSIWRASKPNLRTQQFPLLSLFDEVNRLFDDTTPSLRSGVSMSNFSPTVDLKETATEYQLTGEFPGLDAKDVQIELRDNSICLSGEKRHEHEQKEGERVYRERSYGSFTRTISFEVEVDEDNATADMKNGVLTVKIPKSQKAVKGAKKLTIKAG